MSLTLVKDKIISLWLDCLENTAIVCIGHCTEALRFESSSSKSQEELSKIREELGRNVQHSGGA